MKTPLAERRFIGWDGEGMNLNGDDKPQRYVLFGASTGEYISGRNLQTVELCDFALDVAARNIGAIHVGFAFKYDANMIVRSLPTSRLEYLHKNGYVRWKQNGNEYCIIFRPGKWLSISRRNPGYDSNTNPNAKQTIRIYDSFSFFGCSFVKACRDILGDSPELRRVAAGKAQRQSFAWEDFAEVLDYWQTEIVLLEKLMDTFRQLVYGAGLPIREWHGPGALASYVMREKGIQDHKSTELPPEVETASRVAYAGGRFELFKVGRRKGKIYSYDINSAYPFAIAQLPSLSMGKWMHRKNPVNVGRFGVYRIRLRTAAGFDKAPGPLFYRDERHNISYPWIVEGWYWSPEAYLVSAMRDVEILEGWEWIPDNPDELPFAWVQDMYQQRKEWKRQGIQAQMALKLCMNSLYGKMAQRIGWDEKRNRIPPWHQLEWAGWVTSYTRAKLYGVMQSVPWSHLIGVETDGIYTSYPPELLGITESDELGGWEVNEYDEIIYIQSGLYALRSGRGDWITKYRGLDNDTLSPTDMYRYLEKCGPNEQWQPLIGQTTRFVGIGAALSGRTTVPLKSRHCRWETTTREIMPGEKGKRIHVSSFCRACKDGKNAAEEMHDLVIRSQSRGEMSTAHYIPWAGKDQGAVPEWQEMQQVEDALIL